MARFLCCGDSHIGQGRDLAPDRLAEQEQLWRTILDLARTENVDAVLHGGDMWERRKPTPDEYLAAERPLVEHRAAAGPPVVVVAGNHDRAGVDDNLALKVLEQAGLIRLSTEPERLAGITKNDVHVCTLPWTPVSRLVAAEGGGDRDRIHESAAELLLLAAQGLRAKVTGPAVLVLHWSVSGAALPSGLPIEMAREVILDVSVLEALEFDAVVCAHVHRQQYLSPPLIDQFYVGSPMPLNFGEADQEHGVWLLEVGAEGFVSSEFRPLESRRFLTMTPEDVAASELDGLDAAFVRVVGSAGDVDVAAARNALEAAGASRVSFRLDVERPTRARVEGLSEDTGPIDALTAWLAAQSINGSVGAALVARTQIYLEAVGS